MKVIFLLPDMGLGGAERVVSILSKELILLGHSVDIVCLYGSRIQYEVSKEVDIRDFSSSNSAISKRLLNLRKYLCEQKKTHKKVVVVPFQASCLKSAIVASFFTGVKIVATERTNPFTKGTTSYKRFKASFPFILSDFCIFQTKDARNYYRLLPSKKCMIINNPITPTHISWNNNVSPARLVSVCRLHPGKNIMLSLQVLEKLKVKYPNIHLDIYGTGSIESDLKQYAINLGVEKLVSFKGNTDKVLEELSNHSIYLSTSNYEGVSNSMLEAMSIGMPLICTDCPIGGTRMMLDDECGMLSPVGDANAFAANLDYLLSHPKQAIQMAQNAKKKACGFSPSNIAKEWDNVLNQLV